MADDFASKIALLARWIGESQKIVGFSGAGISTESGVPDFRSPGSPWLKNHPIPFGDFMRSAEMRKEAWRRKFTMDDLYAGARPSAGHAMFAQLVAEGRMFCVITQNIDGLHQASGVPPGRIVELHGNGTYAHCLGCGAHKELAHVRRVFEATGDAPACQSCGGIVKSATISFGQSMPKDSMDRARIAAENADLLIAVGSSLVVYPAASYPVIAQRAGARLVIINQEPTALDETADLVIHARIGHVAAALGQQPV